MHARLILTIGSRAGLAARIHEGVYLVGRDKICQIRPKSRSVSRKHCAIFNDSETLKVLDLKSTSGTRVNGERIPPRTRVRLHDGDQLRCGKVTFSVSLAPLDGIDASEPGHLLILHDEVGEEDDHTMITGAALRESDIADLLLHLDEVDRADRIATIRRRHEEEEKKAKELAETVLVDEDLDTDPQASDEADEQEHEVADATSSAERYKRLDGKTRRSLAARLRRKTGDGFDPQKLALGIIIVAIVLIFVWVVWANYDLFFGEKMPVKNLD